MGSRFILPRFNVIFDIYILDAVSTYFYANELSRFPRGMKVRLHQSTTWPPDGFQMLILSKQYARTARNRTTKMLQVYAGSVKDLISQKYK